MFPAHPAPPALRPVVWARCPALPSLQRFKPMQLGCAPTRKGGSPSQGKSVYPEPFALRNYRSATVPHQELSQVSACSKADTPFTIAPSLRIKFTAGAGHAWGAKRANVRFWLIDWVCFAFDRALLPVVLLYHTAQGPSPNAFNQLLSMCMCGSGSAGEVRMGVRGRGGRRQGTLASSESLASRPVPALKRFSRFAFYHILLLSNAASQLEKLQGARPLTMLFANAGLARC